MSLISFKRAICARDLVVIAREYREHRDVIGMTDPQIHRVALSAEPNLDRGEWNDTVREALEKHPDDANVWLILPDLGTHEADTLESILLANAECPLDPGEVAQLRALRIGEKVFLSIGGGGVSVSRVDPKRRPLVSGLRGAK